MPILLFALLVAAKAIACFVVGFFLTGLIVMVTAKVLEAKVNVSGFMSFLIPAALGFFLWFILPPYL